MRRRLLAAFAAGLTAATANAQNPTPAPTPAPLSFVNAAPAPDPKPAAGSSDLLADSAAAPAGQSVWAEAEYLVWYTRNQFTPQLVVRVADAAVGQGGLAPAGQVRNLYPSNRKIEFDAQSGGRARIGASVDTGIGFDVGGFVLESQTDGAFFASGPNGTPALARTYTRAQDGSRQFLFSSFPGQYTGSIAATADTMTWGMDGNVRFDWYKVLADQNELLAGFRYLNVQESLVIQDRSDFPGGITNTSLDAARTNNHFYGGQVGLHTRFGNHYGVTLDIVQKVALGGVRQRAQLFGANTFGNLPVEASGLYVQQGNAGTFERDKFAAVGELTVNLGYCVRPGVRVFVGYNLLGISSVVRPGQAFDTVINDANVRFVAGAPAGPARRPNFDFGRSATDFWVQGLNLGLAMDW